MADRKGGEKTGKDKSKMINNRSGKTLPQQDICVGEELKIAVSVAIERFRTNEEEKHLEFPSSLTANERAYVHRYCKDLGLISKSRGKGNKRFLTVYKVKEESVTVDGWFNITKHSANAINSLLTSFPVTSRDRHELSGQKLHKNIVTEQSKILARENRLVLGSSPHIPPEPKPTESNKFAINLPIFAHKEEILKNVAENQVVFIAGETGSGKTTQVGQYILENHREEKTPCRIICTQPRRLSAISVAERVAAERGERVGQTIGYQIRLESKLSQNTLLQFCTNGILLRLLMVGHKCLSNITHIIVDEIHERDALSDYLLISLRDLLKSYKKLKVILMSAALNIELFKSYFGACPFINIPGSCFEVKSYFLEHVLKQTGYLNKGMRKMLQDNDKNLFKSFDEESSDSKSYEACSATSSTATDIMNLGKTDSIDKKSEVSKTDAESDVEIEIESDKEDKGSELKTDTTGEDGTKGLEFSEEILEEIEKIDIHNTDENELLDDLTEQDDDCVQQDDVIDDIVEVSEEMNTALAQAWLNGDEEAFDQILHLIMNENIPIDYQHSETKMTSLIVAAARGNITLTEQLIELGANIDICDPKNNRNACGWARLFNRDQVADFLEDVMAGQSNETNNKTAEVVESAIDENDRRRLQLYHKSFDDQKVDISLIMALLNQICTGPASLQGAILIFLPGYDEIMALADRLSEDEEFSKKAKYQILMLHSMLPPNNQRKVFGKPPTGVRKIILSTNIAETSVTIEDIVYVIDSGKVKEKSHDAISGISTLRTVWISKASAIQRRGRAGRCLAGICYHLFSQDRFHHFQMYQDAEILRVPIHELCLQTKMLAPVNVPISDYLSKAPEPPSNLMIRNSIRMLKTISALDDNEDITDLGKLLVELPIDPQLGKIILMGMVLKCLEPAIIIACCSSYKEPCTVLLPTFAALKAFASAAKLKLSSDSSSDHIAMLRAFQGWQKAKREGRDKLYCHRNYISPGTMEMVQGMRHQILSQLRNLGLVRSRGSGDLKDLNSNSNNWSVVKAAVGAGMYPNFIKVDRDNLVLVSEREKKVNIHNSSVVMAKDEDKVQSTRAKKLKSIVSSLPFDWLAYEELSRLYYSVQIRTVSVLSPLAVALVGGPCLSYEHSCLRLKSSRDKGRRNGKARETFFQESDSEQEEVGDENTGTFKIDDWITFSADDNSLNSIAMLRMKFLSLFSKHIQLPTKPWSEADDAIVQCIAYALAKEEFAVGITSPVTKDLDKYMRYDRSGERYPERGYRNDSHSSRGNSYSRGGHYGNESRGRRRFQNSRQYRRRHYSDDKSSDEDSTSIDDGGKESKQREKSFFIIKCNDEKNMEISFNRGIWATTKGNEKKLNRAFHKSQMVCLIFSVQGSGHFQGVAKMTSGIGNRRCDDFGSANLGGVFDVEWIYKKDIAFQQTQHLCNPWNDNKKVQISRDTQELEPSVGEALVALWNTSPESPLSPQAKRPQSQSPVEGVLEENVNQVYPMPEMYDENEAPYVDGYPLYSPPPFSPQFMPEFQPVPPHYAAPHMAYQQPYPVYGPATGMPPPYRQEYYQFQYPPQRRGAPSDIYGRGGGQYESPRQDSRRNNTFR